MVRIKLVTQSGALAANLGSAGRTICAGKIGRVYRRIIVLTGVRQDFTGSLMLIVIAGRNRPINL